MHRHKLGADQFEKVAGFLGILSGVTIKQRAQIHNESVAYIEFLRGRVFDIYLAVSRYMDDKALEDGTTDTHMWTDESGQPIIGETLSFTKMTQAAISSIKGMSDEDAVKAYGYKKEAFPVLKASFQRKLLYTAAAGMREHPDYSIFDLMNAFTNEDNFTDWNDQAVEFLDEDDSTED